MKKKTIGILLMISLVMIMSISAISAADANDTLQEQVSDTDIETISSNLEAGDTAASTLNEVGTDVEKISASEAQIEKSNQKADNASSKLNDDVISASNDDVLKADKENNLNNDMLSASNDDVLGDNPNFLYNGQWYEDLDAAVSAACDNNGGTIKLTARAWGYDSAEREITISKGVSITFEPIDADAEVIFDGNDYSGNVNNRWWFFKIDDKNARVTFNRITFRNGGDGSLACDGGAIRIVHGQVTMTDCIFDNNKARENKLGGYGLGGAIYLDESDASLNAYNCSFTNNNADNGGGAVFVEDGATASFENCYFEGNKADGSINHVQTDEGDGSSYSFTDCLFKGDGSIGVTKNPLKRQVEISPEVNDDDADHIILYKDGAEYARKSYDGADVTFGDLETLLEPGNYTVYMAKGDAYSTEKRYDYNKQFTIVEPNFVLTKGEDTDVFENLKQAIAAIDNGESGEIYVAGGTWNGTDNLGLYVSNKTITIMPKPAIMPKPVDASDDEPVVFLGLEESYFLSLDYGQLIMNDINITGGFTGAALNFNYCTECYISDCAFDNIGHLATIITPYPNPSVTYYVDGPGFPIYAYCTTLALDECTFDSSKQSLFRNSTVNITDCEYTNNSGLVGGAINADSTSNLTITGSEFSLNEATDRGGAIFATNLKINDTEFKGNIAPIGGAIYITNQSDSEVNISGCVFDSNFAENYRNIYTESATREITLMFNEYDLNLAILEKDGVYGVDYIMETVFDWGVNLNNNDTLILGTLDDETPFLELVDIEGDKFTLNLGVLSGGPHEIILDGMCTQGDSLDHFVGQAYYTDLNGNQFYLDINKWASLKFNIEKAKIALNLTVENVLIPKIPVLNLYANFDENFTIFLGTTVYQVQVVNGKGSLELTGLDLGNYTVVAMRSSDENFELALNFTTFSVSKTYSNFLVLSTNVEYKTLKEAIVNSNDDDTIYIKKGTYNDTGIVISNKTLDIIALEGAVFDAQGRDVNFIIVEETAEATIYGITFRGIHNRNTNYGAIVNHGYLTVNSCNFTDNKITKTSFDENGGAAIFSDGDSLEIDNCNFINNVAPLKAGAAAVTSLGYEDVSITSSRFINNTAREGGALHFKNLIQFESAVSSCDFEHNTAVKGSAIYIGNNSMYVSVTLSGFTKNDIKNNKGENTQLEGGVIYVNANDAEVTLNIDSSHFESNSNKDVDGGVICLDGTSNANIDTCIFKDNKGKVGSVILVKNPNNEKLRLFIESSVLANNSATRGAIATSPKVTAFLDECVFADNTGEYRNIYSNGFTVAHDSIFDVKNAELNARNVKYGESSVISGKADTGTNLYSAANLTVAGENVTVEIKDNTFTYTTDILNSGKHHAVLNGIVDYNNNTYVMDSITKIFRVNKATIDLNVSVDNIIYGETLKVTETLPANVNGTIGYYLNGVYYTKEELESLKLDVGKHTLVAYYNHEDYEPAYSLVDFNVYKAKANISVADVEVEAGESIILNIETNAPSIYTIEIGKYKFTTLINGSKSIEVDETFAPGTYTIRVTSKERVNYISSSTEAVLKVNEPEQTLVTSLSTSQSPIDEIVLNTLGANNFKLNSQDDLLIAANDEILSDDESIFDDYEETGNFIYQEDEDDEPQYFDTLEEAIDEASLMGGIITVRGGTYNGWGFCGIDIEGELEITIRAYPGEEVIFDCEGEDYFLHLTYDTEVEMIETVPPIPIVYTTEGPTITLENITVINGYNSEGGAIELVAGTLTMINCNFYNNFAEDYGGAICIGSMNSDQDATVIALNCTFMNNIAGEEGGAIYIEADWEQESTASFAFCTFLDNFQGEEGSRTRNYFAGPEVNEITSQYCVFDGTGEIYSVDIDKIEQIVIVNGTSPDPFDSVVLLYNNTLPLYTVYNNGSRDFYVTFEDVIGGNYTLGVMNDHNFNTYIFGEPFEVKVANFFISKDDVFENLTDAIEAVEENGIIYANFNYHIEENMEIDITKSFIIKNYKGRMVIFDGNATQWFFTVAEGCNVVFEGVNFTDGGMNNFASFENKGTLTFKDCIFSDFETGAIIYNTGILIIINSEFSDNTLYSAIVLNEGKLSIDSSTFTGNIINTNSVIFNNGIADITSSTFTENINFGNGGAIYSTNSLNITDTVFRENEGIDGGAIYNTGTMQVKNSTFEDNTANGYGGAIYNEGELNVFESTFTGGFSERDGGAIYNNNVANVDNSTFIANTATGNGGAIYNNKKLVLTDSFFGINYGEEFANIYNAGNIEFTSNTFDFYDVILYVPYGQYDIPTVITGTLDPQFNMDVQLILPGFVNNTDALAYLQEGIFEYDTGILPKGIYPVKLDEIIYDTNGNVYYGEAVTDRLIITKANVTLNITVDDIVLKNASQGTPVLKINASKDGIVNILFNNKLITVNITDGYAEKTLDSVEEGNYSVMVFRAGDENYNDAVNTTTFKVSEYEGNFIVDSGGQFDTLREAIEHAVAEDIIYVREGNYTGADNLGVTVSGKKLTITPLGEVVFDAELRDLSFLTIDETSDVTLEDITITGFHTMSTVIISNNGNLIVDGCVFANNNLGDSLIDNYGDLTVVESSFYDNDISIYLIYSDSQGRVIINESSFESNIAYFTGYLLSICYANSAKIISNDFVENKVSGDIIYLKQCSDVLIDSVFTNNTKGNNVIWAYGNSNLLVENSVFTGNELSNIISSTENNQIIKDCTFTDNTVKHVVDSTDDKLTVIGSTFSANTVSGNGTLYTTSNDVTIDDCLFTGNKADNYRNIYSVSTDVKITNNVFDAINVDYSVYDIDYAENETIEGTIDIGTNLNFTVNLKINSKTYSVNVTDNKFAYNLIRPSGGDYTVILDSADSNSNSFVFDQITRTFTVNRVDPNLKVIIPDINHGEKLNVTLFGNRTNHVVFELNGKSYTNETLQDLTLAPGDYLIIATFAGDMNYLPATVFVNVKVHKVTPNITVNDVVVDYGDDVKIDAVADAADYYTAIIGNETLTYYIRDKVTFAFPALDLKPGSYEIIVYVFENNEHGEAYANATLTVNKADGVFRLNNDIIIEGENATVSVNVPLHADGNITYNVFSEDLELVYNITQSCLEELVVPGLTTGNYMVTGTYSGDSYYTAMSKVTSGTIYVNTPIVDLTVTASEITYGEPAVITVNSKVDGEYLVWVDEENFTVNVIDGTGNVSVHNLNAGNHTANATIIHDYYVAYNEAVFEVAPKPVWVVVIVEDIVQGEDAIVHVYGEIDGKYIVEVNNQTYTVNVTDGEGNTTVSDLNVVGDMMASVSIDENNYAASDNTTFNVASKEVTAIVSVGNIIYGDEAIVIVQSNVSGDYIVTIRDVNYTVHVNGGNGVIFVQNLTVGNQIPVTVKRDDRHTAFNKTAFDITPKMVNVALSVEDITWNEKAIINITAEIDGMYTLTVNNVEYPIKVTGGKATQVITDLVAKNYDAQIVIVNGNYSASNQTEFNVAPKPVNLIISVEGITYGDEAKVIVKSDADGEYLVYVDGTPYSVNVTGGVGNVPVGGLTVGDHVANVTVVDGNYSGSNSTTFAVAIKQVNVAVAVDGITYGDDANVTVKSDVDGEYLVYVDGTPYTVVVSDGVGDVPVGGLTVGDHVANVTVVDGNYSGSDSTTFNVSKAKTEVDIDFENETTGTPLLEFRLPSDAGGNVSVYVNDKLSQVVNLTNGSANIIVTDLNIGSNNVTVVYSGDDNYDSLNKSFTINRKATIDAYDMTRGYNSGLDYTAKLYGADGSPLPNANVTIKVGTNTYTVQTDSDGVFKFNEKLDAGDYAIAIVNPETGEYKLTNLKIVKRITENKDATIFFADNSNYKVRVVGDDGSYVGAGEVVSMNVGGKTYSVKTDKDGYATLKLSLYVKKHTITVTYKGFTTKNQVTVKSVVKPVKKTVKVKKTAKKLKIKVKLKGKKVLKKKRVYMKFKGKTYKAKTNNKGIATFKVPKKVIKKLKKGKKYTAKFTYKAKANGKTIKDTAKCKVNVK